ncbi:peptidoglycan DD-metalloendopeptidase family protein [Bacillus sp. FJAT-22090]|uniref:peptidoglycan DD-metalloendopeptidase family protein n=1 Tax=Bacillus sp. FJAT-22090 TaxID=1581038 RepID=UPI0011A2E26E|nr:peptidoglycan DD-metalloendopeptidase family protein [Bacillus sp. FJAT-22090]
MADFIKPNTAPYTSHFGARTHPITGVKGKMHYGIDFSGHSDDAIRASASGTVIRTIHEGSLGGFGNFIILSHNIRGQMYTTIYAHLSSLKVRTGQTVIQGQQIGIKGNTGSSTSKHLHFEIHKGGNRLYTANTAVDPLLYMFDEEVLAVQQLLNKSGYKLTEDGISGESTTKTIKSFQQKNGLAADGIAGANTIAKLKAFLNQVGSVYNPTPTKLMWGKTEFKKGQIGKLTILKPINLWKDVNGKLTMERVLNPSEEYRVYGYRELHGGQYDVGGGMWVTKMSGYIKYETPSKSLLKQAGEFYK